jgi:small subunit ribosomal protein S17
MKDKAVRTREKDPKKIVKSRVGTRGRIFQGVVMKKFEGRVVMELERTVKVTKYERFAKKKTRLHVKIPEGMSLKVGDNIRVRECRPLSKMIHFIVIGVLKGKEHKKE